MIRTLTVLLILIVGLPVYAQIDELDELAEDVKCIPDSFNTIYDQYKEEGVTETQIAIWYSLAQEEYKYKKYKRALPYFWKVLMNDTTGKFKVVYSKIADSYFRLNQPDSTLLIAYMGLEKYPDRKTLHYWAGLIHDKRGHVECAIPHYEKLVTIDPTNKNYWAKLAILYFNNEDERAIEAQQKVCELDPSDVEAFRLLAQFMEHFGRDPLKILKETWLKDSTNTENAYRYGTEAFDAGQYQEAIRPFKAILLQDSRNTAAMEYIGRSYEALDKRNMAISIYKDILKIEPKNVNVVCLISSIYSSQNQFTKARSYLNQARRIEPSDGMPYLIMAGIYENAVAYCSASRSKRELTYDDKLVYKKAVDEYNKASRDPNYAADAKRRAKQLANANLLPTKEDYFMHNNRMEPKEECYSWMK